MTQPLTDEPRDYLLDDAGELVVTTDLQFSRGIQAVVQSCRIALQMFQGEWFLDLDAGIPYFDSILGQKPNAARAAAEIAFRRELLAAAGVISILKLEIEYVAGSRTLSVNWQVQTALGETPVDTIALAIGGAS